MQNWHRWVLTLVLGFAGGVIQCASSGHSETAADYIRSGIIGLGPAIGALNLSLQKTEAKP